MYKEQGRHDFAATRTCEICGETKTVFAPATGHSGDCFCDKCGEHLCDAGENCPSKAFTDLKADLEENPARWWHIATDYVICNELMNGMSETEFERETAATRGMIVTTIYRLEGEPEYTKEAGYSDVADGRYYTDAINWATENGIVNGMGGNKFQPKAEVTREQIATMFYRYAEYKGLDVSASMELSGYEDASTVHNYAVKAVKWAAATGFMEGRKDGEKVILAARENTKRQELATILMRWETGLAK